MNEETGFLAAVLRELGASTAVILAACASAAAIRTSLGDETCAVILFTPRRQACDRVHRRVVAQGA